jgi:hypothetical protein
MQVFLRKSPIPFLRRNYAKTTGGNILKDFLKLSKEGKRDELKEMGFNYEAATDGFFKNYQSDPFDDLQDTEPDKSDEKEYNLENLNELLEDVAQDLLTKDPQLKKLKRKHEQSQIEAPEDDIKKQFSEEMKSITVDDLDEQEKKFEIDSLVEVELEMETISTYKQFCQEFGNINKAELIDFAGGLSKKRVNDDVPKVGDTLYLYEINKKTNLIERKRKVLKAVIPQIPKIKLDPKTITFPALDALEKREEFRRILEDRKFNEMSVAELEKFEKESKEVGVEVNLEKEKRMARLRIQAATDPNTSLYLSQIDENEQEYKRMPGEPVQEEEEEIVEKEDDSFDLIIKNRNGREDKTVVPRNVFEGEQVNEEGENEMEDEVAEAYAIFQREGFSWMKEEWPHMTDQDIHQYLEIGEDDNDPILNEKRDKVIQNMLQMTNIPNLEDLMRDLPDSTDQDDEDAQHLFYEKQREEFKDIFDFKVSKK